MQPWAQILRPIGSFRVRLATTWAKGMHHVAAVSTMPVTSQLGAAEANLVSLATGMSNSSYRAARPALARLWTWIAGISVMLWASLAAAHDMPTATQATTADVRAALNAAGVGKCRDQLEAELTGGQWISPECSTARAQATRALARGVKQKPVFGIVEQRKADVGGISLTLALASSCRRWPLRGPQSDVLRSADSEAAQCRQQRFSGPLTVTGIARDGRRIEGLLVLQVPADGRVRLTYAELERSLVARGYLGIDAFTRFSLGERAWAGSIDAEALRRALREAHLRWVLAGRGVPALFAIRHPEHERASTVRALANASTLLREERDYHAVLAGLLPPERFLERYLASRYRIAVENLFRSKAAVAGSN